MILAQPGKKGMDASIKFILSGLIIAILGGTAPSSTGMDDNSSNIRRVDYELELIDPLHPDLPAQSWMVQLALNDCGFPQEYRLHLLTGVCPDRVCQLLKATLIWDAAGNYLRLEVPPHAPLTKINHDLFLPGDYARLDRILKDKTSALGTYPLNYFNAMPDSGVNNVDGVTSATMKSVQDAVVPGAAYTSWVLWRWVNGEAVDKLRDLTRRHVSVEYLKHGLMSGNENLAEFSLEHMLANRITSPELTESALRLLMKGEGESRRLALQYLLAAQDGGEQVCGRMVELIGVDAQTTRLALNFFEALPKADLLIWEQMAGRLKQVEAYQDVNRMLNLLEKHAGESEPVRRRAAELLDSENRFIVRRAREFLGE